MANALIEGVEYQHGTLEGYEVKQYLLTVNKAVHEVTAERSEHKCAYCGGLSGDSVLEIEAVYEVNC